MKGKYESLFLSALVLLASGSQISSVHSLSNAKPAHLNFLQRTDDACNCRFSDTCSCGDVLQFATCISDGCNSGQCDCMGSGTNHFQAACEAQAEACPGAGLTCESHKATCDGDFVSWYSEDRPARGNQKTNEDESEEDEGNKDDDLPPGWEKAWSEEHERYYFANRETGETSWEKPTQASAVMAEKTEQDDQDDDDDDDDNTKKTTFKKNDWVKKPHYHAKVKKLHSHEHHVFAKGIITTVIVLCMTACFALSSNTFVMKNTWSHINAVVVTFLALSWYYVVMHFLEIAHYKGIWKVLMHLTIGMLLLLASSLISWFMQKSARLDANAEVSEGVATFNEIFTPMVMWTFAGTVSTAQQLVKPGGPPWVLFATFVMMVFYIIVALVWYYVIGGITRKTWDDDRVDALAGAALAAGIVLWIHMIVSGGYQTIEDPHPNAPNLDKTLFMNVFGMLYIIIACVATPPLHKLQNNAEQNRKYWLARCFSVLQIFVAWLPFFSCILSLGHLIVDNLGYKMGAIEARLLVAVVSTAIGFAMIQLCARTEIKNNADISKVLLELGGKMVGASWSGLLDNSINMMVKGYEHPFWMKLQITAFLTAFIFPTYFYCLKPLIDQKTKAK